MSSVSGKPESFQKRVEQFIGEVSFFVRKESDRQELTSEIVRLVLGIQTGMGSTALRRIAFRNNVLDDFTFFKNQYLDVSYYIHRQLWKGVVRHVNESQKYVEEPLKSDIEFCLKNLGQRDMAKVRDLKINEDLNVDGIDLNTFTTGKKKPKDLQTYVKTKSYTLNFLSDYDPGFMPEDFDQDLLCETVRVANVYGRSKCKNLHKELLDENQKPQKMTDVSIRLQKYVETALNNKVDNLKEYHTCENRRRVSTTDSELYKEKNKIKKLLQKNATYHANKEKVQDLKKMIGIITKDTEKRNHFKKELLDLEQKMSLDPLYKDLKTRMDAIESEIRHSNGDYFSMVTPLVRHDEGEDRVIEVADEKENEQKVGEQFLYHSEKTFDERLWIDGICEEVPENIATFVRIVTGDHSPAFETWAQEQGIDTSYFDAMVNGAKRYCNVTKSQLLGNQELLQALTDR